jgi:hypothetical protein
MGLKPSDKKERYTSESDASSSRFGFDYYVATIVFVVTNDATTGKCDVQKYAEQKCCNGKSRTRKTPTPGDSSTLKPT